MKLYKLFPALLLLTGCAGWSRDCNSGIAGSFDGDWLVVQYGFDGAPINCWKLKDTAISNEAHTDGVFWQDPDGHLVHISGWYNRVQVNNSNFESAAKTVGIELSRCTGGKYVAPVAPVVTPPIKTGYYNGYESDSPWAFAQR